LGITVSDTHPVRLRFTADRNGTSTGIDFSYLRDQDLIYPTSLKTLAVYLTDLNTTIKTSGILTDSFSGGDDPRGNSYTINFDLPVNIKTGHEYELEIILQTAGEAINVIGAMDLAMDAEGVATKYVLPEPVSLLHAGESYDTSFIPIESGNLTKIYLNRVVDWEKAAGLKTISISIGANGDDGIVVLGTARISNAFLPSNDIRGDGYWLDFDKTIQLDKSQTYLLSLRFIAGSGALAIYGSRQANESTWDDALPYSVYGLNPFDYYNGVYRTDLNFEMYWDDNTAKLQRFESVLDQADYIFISSNRQWGSITRLPEYYPLTAKYYRELIGCPEDKEITWCYSVATPGMFKGSLGFNLVQVFQSDPNIGPIKFNTQFAEEAFTVYDHPKVLIFKKADTYDSEQVQRILGSVDLNNVPSISNYKVTGSLNENTRTLTLPAAQLEIQQAGGTWAELFNINSVINKYPVVGLIVWYLFISTWDGWFFRTTRIVFKGLKDRGYPFGRVLECSFWLCWSGWLGLCGFHLPFLRFSSCLQ